jgi:hypothetical protein
MRSWLIRSRLVPWLFIVAAAFLIEAVRVAVGDGRPGAWTRDVGVVLMVIGAIRIRAWQRSHGAPPSNSNCG